MKNLLAILLIGSIAISACSSKKDTKPDETGIPTAKDADQNSSGDSDSGKALGLQTIHFQYDSFTLDSNAKTALTAGAQILKDKASVKIQVEGHCDARGGIQYNLGLGEKRANAVKKFLVDAGISKDRISTISFGKERPLDPAETEEAYAKNRRANFVITAR